MQINKTSVFKLWLPVFLYAGFIFYMSSIPTTGLPSLFPHADKLIHIAEYTLFAWFITRAIKYSFNNIRATKLYFIVILINCIYGLSDEFHQSFVATRHSSIWDVVADTIGGIIGVFLYL